MTNRKTLQCKHLDTTAILLHIAKNGGSGCTVWSREEFGVQVPYDPRSVANAVPYDTPIKLLAAKMWQLEMSGLVDGGCHHRERGDFEITAKGAEHLTKQGLFFKNQYPHTLSPTNIEGIFPQ